MSLSFLLPSSSSLHRSILPFRPPYAWESWSFLCPFATFTPPPPFPSPLWILYPSFLLWLSTGFDVRLLFFSVSLSSLPFFLFSHGGARSQAAAITTTFAGLQLFATSSCQGHSSSFDPESLFPRQDYNPPAPSIVARSAEATHRTSPRLR